ncbi:hypothetical protein VMCG_02707 [Cytospora schulzeri]|uniref:F-box domain-containing protein n=1 Tax=Cytospora schulzeri TaxID=448051 RepID=A0A423WZ20_9PEZI|nr:hypothetical protein VMCG_02707 [Valsa malicola]
MVAYNRVSILGVPNTLSSGMAAQLIGDTESPTTPICTKRSIHSLSTELLFNIVDQVDSYDLHSLNLTSKTFHLAIRQQRWTHARLVGRPQHMSNMIQHLLQMVQDPNSLVNLKNIKSVSIIVLPDPDPVTQKIHFNMDWALVDDFKYPRFSPPEIPSKLVQLLNLLSNKEECSKLNHITFDPSGVAQNQISKFNELQKTDLHPINIASMRIKGKGSSGAIYRLIGKCVPTQLHTVHLSHPLARWPIEDSLSPHWNNLRKLHFAADGCTTELTDESKFNAPNLEWLSIDGYDYIYSETTEYECFLPERLKERPRNLARKCPKLKRLAITWRCDKTDPHVDGFSTVEPPDDIFLSIAYSYFDENLSLEMMTFRWEFPYMLDLERVDGQEELRETWRNALEEPREDG